jgi:hypothetical protein
MLFVGSMLYSKTSPEAKAVFVGEILSYEYREKANDKTVAHKQNIFNMKLGEKKNWTYLNICCICFHNFALYFSSWNLSVTDYALVHIMFWKVWQFSP